MAGNKFRNFRKKEEKEEENKADIWRDSEIIFKRDFQMLTKAFDASKYYSQTILKKGTILKAVDLAKNHNKFYLKVKYPDNNDNSAFGYIPFSDTNGESIFEKYERENQFSKKDNEDKKVWNYETYGFVKLGDANNNEKAEINEEDIKCHKNKNELMNKMISLMNDENSDNSSESTNNDSDKDISEKKKYLCGYYALAKEMEKEKKTEKKTENSNKPENNNNNSLDPTFERGVQVIVIPLSFDPKFLYRNHGVGHAFVRYFDRQKGIDKIIESNGNGSIGSISSLFGAGTNEIKFDDFKKEKLKEYKILKSEELTKNDIDFEGVKKALIDKYGEKCIRGHYEFKNNNCFHTASEVLNLFNKSSEEVKKYHEKYILSYLNQIESIWLDEDDDYLYIKFKWKL